MYKTDTYLSEVSYPLDDVNRDVLTYLYLPLIGNNAYSLYHFLYSEGRRMDRVHIACGISRLTTALNISVEELAQACAMIEGIGLMRTLCKDDHEYLFIMQSPLSLKRFFRNQVLVTLLRHTIGDEEFIVTQNHFKMSREDRTHYQEVTARFSEIYSVDLKNTRPLKTHGHYVEHSEKDVQVDYDLTLFYESLKDAAIPSRLVKPYERMIKEMAVLYSIDEITLSSLVRESFVDHRFSSDEFTKRVHNYYNVDRFARFSEVHRRQSEKDQSIFNEHTPLSQHLHYLETISPYQLLKNKQGGSEPILHDLSIAETLMTQLHLSPGVTNMLLEYVLGHNDNKLSRSYCETIGAAWSRKHIKNAKQAYEEVMKMQPEKQEKKKQAIKKQNTSKKAQETIDSSHIDLDEMLANLNEGDGS